MFFIVVNYDKDNGWTSILDNFKETPRVSKEVENALNALNDFNLQNINSAEHLGQRIGYTNEEFFKFAKQADLSGDVLQQYKDYTASATTATSKFAATLKTVAANIAIMLAVTAGIKLIAFTYDQIAHRQENLNEKAAESAKVYGELQDEVDSLNEKHPIKFISI